MNITILSTLALCALLSAPAPDPPETVVVTYRVKAGKEAEFLRVLGTHWPTLRRLGLALEQPHIVLRGEDEEHKTYFIEVMTWKSHEAPDTAPPEVQKIWAAMEPLVEPRLGHRAIEFPEVQQVDLR